MINYRHPSRQTRAAQDADRVAAILRTMCSWPSGEHRIMSGTGICRRCGAGRPVSLVKAYVSGSTYRAR